MLVSNVIRPSSSLWASCVVLAQNPSGEVRYCADYRRVNSITKKDLIPCLELMKHWMPLVMLVI